MDNSKLYARVFYNLRNGEEAKPEYGLFAMQEKIGSPVRELARAANARDIGIIVSQYEEEIEADFGRKSILIREDPDFPQTYRLADGQAVFILFNIEERNDFREGYNCREENSLAKSAPWRVGGGTLRR